MYTQQSKCNTSTLTVANVVQVCHVHGALVVGFIAHIVLLPLRKEACQSNINHYSVLTNVIYLQENCLHGRYLHTSLKKIL